jgi:hypothetical protein
MAEHEGPVKSDGDNPSHRAIAFTGRSQLARPRRCTQLAGLWFALVSSLAALLRRNVRSRRES